MHIMAAALLRRAALMPLATPMAALAIRPAAGAAAATLAHSPRGTLPSTRSPFGPGPKALTARPCARDDRETNAAAMALATVAAAPAPQADKVYRTLYPPRKGFLNEQNREILDKRAVVVLQHNNLSFSEWIAVRHALAQHNFRVRVVRNVLVRAQIRNSRYEAMQPLFHGPTALAYTDDEEVTQRLQGVLAAVAKQPKLIVVGAKVESSLVTTDELARIVRLPGLQHLRAELVATLQGPMTLLAAVLQQTPQLLVANLQAVADGKGKDKDTPAP